MDLPTFADVLAARRRIAPYLRPTPLYRYPALDAVAGTEVWVKHENHQPIGAFKVRGGVNLMSRLAEEDRRRGVATASTGNHGQSIAWAGRLFGVPVLVCVPEGANPVKVEAIRLLGATVVAHGPDFEAAREHCERLAEKEGRRYVHAANEPDLIAGVATETLEIFEEQPDVEVLVVPVGGGSGASGACLVRRAVRPATEVVAVQAEAAPAGQRSWQAGRVVQAPMATAAEGVATSSGYELPQRILRELLDDFVLVSEEAMRAASLIMIEKTRNLVELSGAAPLAAVLADPARFAGRKVALVCTGGNVSPAQLRELLNAG
jgi:threonine dehydratase